MSYSYMITLTPIEPYFFGGEFTFGADDSRDGSSRYNASSTYFPQQTALMGMLRKTLLIQNGCMTLHRRGEWVDKSRFSNAVSLCGRGSFSYEEDYDTGLIQQISPVFIVQNDLYFIPDAKDQKYSPRIDTKSTMMIGDVEQPCIVFEGHNPKEYTEMSLVSQDGKIRKSVSELFQPMESVGIKKSYSGQAQEEAFFQRTAYLLKDKGSFAMIATFGETIELSETIVTLGADQSSFKMCVKQVQSSFRELFSKAFEPKQLDRVILMSETLVSSEAEKFSMFSFGERKSYRYLKPQTNGSSNGKKSKRYFLFERGSVLYTSNLESLEAQLSIPHLQKAGINHFITIKGDK